MLVKLHHSLDNLGIWDLPRMSQYTNLVILYISLPRKICAIVSVSSYHPDYNIFYTAKNILNNCLKFLNNAV